MKTKDFSFDAPSELIAQRPLPERSQSRLMVIDRQNQTIRDSRMVELPSLLAPGAVLVCNNSRVRKARLIGTAEATGGIVEFLLLSEIGGGVWRVLTSKSRRQKIGKAYRFPEGRRGTLVDIDGEVRVLRFSDTIDEDYLQKHGRTPLPPYIKRAADREDETRYQTVYAEAIGSSAAPTAGLHFDAPLLEEIRRKEVEIVFLTLHVGLATFSPIRAERVEDHEMHEERYTIPASTASAVNRALSDKRDVAAVGTTVVRALESSFDEASEGIQGGYGTTNLYIIPGFAFRVVHRLLTNFHTPQSTLLLMVSAFAGKELIREAYARAIRSRYRLFSYGDAMYIH